VIRGSSSCTGMLYTSAYVGCLVSYILIDIQAYILSCSVQFMLWHHSCFAQCQHFRVRSTYYWNPPAEWPTWLMFLMMTLLSFSLLGVGICFNLVNWWGYFRITMGWRASLVNLLL